MSKLWSLKAFPWRSFSCALIYGLLRTTTAFAQGGEAAIPVHVQEELIVEFEPAASDDEIAAALVDGALEVREHVRTRRMKDEGKPGLTRVRTRQNVDAAARRLKRHRAVRFAEPNWVYTHQATANDPYYAGGQLWGAYGDTSSPANAFGSQAAEVWAGGQTGSRQVYVGIIDEGVQVDHPDLAANMWTNPFDPVDGVDNDGNGYIDDTRGWNFFGGNNVVYDPASDDHGTHVAGTIGAVGGNQQGIVGLNWAVTMIPAKFLGPQGGTTLDAVKAIDYFVDLKVRHGLNIVALNNSWGGGGYSTALHAAINRAAKAGILFVAAAGNGDSNGNGLNNDTVANYPSNYDTTTGNGIESAATFDGVVAVAALDRNGNRANFSNYGATKVDLGAPGVQILSTVPGGGYSYYSGTSMATPHVTGAAALYAAAFPGRTAAQIRTALLDGARATPTTALAGLTVTGGRLNIGGILTGSPAPSAPAAPTNLAAAAGNAQVSLTWTASSGAASYTVKRAGAASGPFASLATSVATTDYNDTTVVNGTTYHYVVTAVSTNGESPNSNVASGTPVAPPTEGTTGLLTVTTLGTPRNNFTGWVGLRITPKVTLTVTDLGRLTSSGNSGAHAVKLVHAASLTDVPNGRVTVAMAGAAAGTFRYAPLATPVVLTANTSYFLVSEELLGGDLWCDFNTIVSPKSVATCDGAVYAGSGYPWTVIGGANRSYVPVDLRYQATTTPAYIVALSALPATGGTVSGAGTFAAGTSTTVNAAAQSGYQFVNWTENGNTVSVAPAYTFNVDRDRALVANFSATAVNYTITTASAPAQGGSTSGGGVYPQGASVTVVATPADGFRFVNWSANGSVVSTTASYSFTASASRALTANFEVVASGGEQRLVSSLTLGLARSDFSGWVGMQLTVGAQPLTVTSLGRFALAGNSGSHVLKLVRVDNGVDVPGATVTINMAGSVAGDFRYATLPSPVTLEAGRSYYLVSQEQLGGDKWGDLNTRVVIGSAAACNGAVYFWGRWERPSGANTTYVPLDLKYSAATGQTYTVTTTASPASGGAVSGGGTFSGGAAVTVNASANSGYAFVNWSEGGVVVSTTPSYSFTAAAHRTLVATFQATGGGSEAAFVTSVTPGRLRYESSWGGMKFTVGSQPLTLTALARFCAPGNSRAHTVKLIEASTGRDVVGGSVVVSMAGATPGQFVYQNLGSPVTLAANTTYYLLSEESWYADAWYDFDTRLTTTSAASCDGAGYLWYGWTNEGGSNSSRGPVSFKYRL